jgi:pimeloyl-ACP methyl ester carboxylesterase
MMGDVAAVVKGVIVPGTAHWVPEEQPEAFVSALLEFISG